MSRIDILRQRIVKRLQRFENSREPRHEIIWGLLGDIDGTVSVPNQSGKVYCRLLGLNSILVRAWNATVPLVANLRVDVEVERQEGMPNDYSVLGIAKVGYGGYENETRFYLPPHHETHEYSSGEGGYDIVNVYTRALAELRADAQATPDMTLHISAGLYMTETHLVIRAAADSPAFSAAPAAGYNRFDLLYLNTSNNQYEITEGTAALAGFAARPLPESKQIAIVWVFFQAGDTAITNSMLIDARVFLLPVGALELAEHALDPQAANSKHTGTLAGLHAHVYNENKSNECDGAKTVFITAHEFMPEYLGVFLNGQLLTLDDDYTEGAFYDSFTMSTAPIAGDTFIVAYAPQIA